MITADELILEPIKRLKDINGVPFPEEPRFRQFLITGPPGSGKSTQVGKMRGWPYEGYLDLAARNWWRVQALTFRPREVHLGAPFKGYAETLSVLDDDWLDNCDTLEIDFRRILIPPTKSWFWGTNWRKLYAFEFILPPAEIIYRDRMKRAKTGLFPHDRNVTKKIVSHQVDFYRTIAWFFWVSGIHVYLRIDRDGAPMKIVDCKNAPKL